MRFSVIIPTYQRRDIVVRMVSALERQVFRDFEVVVVVDGSRDGTAHALRRLSLGFPLTVIEQGNQGAATARNAGAAVARGELLLFLDDDMEADPLMLSEHDRSHRDGASIVLGHLPLHPDSPPTLLTAGVDRWAERRRTQLVVAGGDLPVADLLTGQLSIARVEFERLGGFDTGFTRDGMFGGEDIDFGCRAKDLGLRIIFNPAAISYQYYDVDPAVYTRRSREAGRSAEELSIKHPEHAEELRRGRDFSSRRSRIIFGTLARAPAPVRWLVRALAVRLVRRPNPRPRIRRLFLEVQAMERLRGSLHARRRLQTGKAIALAYHAISDLSSDPILSEYGIPPARFAEHIDTLSSSGWRFVTLDQMLDALDGQTVLPPRSLLLTFDDGYADVLSSAYPLLAERAIPATVFAVSDRLGATNEWDRALGASVLPLLDEEGLLAVADRGLAVGSHGATHRPLVGLERGELESELQGSADRLESVGVPRPRVLAYPHGQWSTEIIAAVHRAGYRAAFTVRPGVVRRSENRYALPRVEVYASDTPTTLRVKLATASLREPWRTGLLRVLRVT